MLSIEKCIEAFFKAETVEEGWYYYWGKKAKAANLEAKEGAIWDYGWYKICQALKEPPEGFRIFAERPIYYLVYDSYDSPSSKRHWRLMAEAMHRYSLDWILGYKDPFIPLFGFHTSRWPPFEVETCYGMATHYGNHFQWKRVLDGKIIYVLWKPLERKPFTYAGEGYQTDWIFWNVSFQSDKPLEDAEIYEIFTRKERRMRKAAEIIAEIKVDAKALGFWGELKRAMGNFPETSGNLGKLKKLQRKVRALTGSDEELVQYILSERKDEI
jgi:hypothetical protein